jgi:hypothetical protein
LAYLLGINLMPRIKNWKSLTFYRPDKKTRYEHIDALFSNHIDWKLIAENFDEMLKVAISIKAGKLLPSTILRRLGSYNRQNRLNRAFHELGRVVRTDVFGSESQRCEQIGFGKEFEARRRHPDDGVAPLIERYGLPDDLRVCAEATLPEAVTDERDLIVSGLELFGGEGATH